IGSGGREHALVWALAQSPQRPKVFCAPGNAGTAQLGVNVEISPMDFGALVEWVRNEEIDLTIVGPEQPLVAGVVDFFRSQGLPIVGPSAYSAQLEGSKGFAKRFMAQYHIPTATYRTFSSMEYEEAKNWLAAQDCPIVLKADGLAAGKGVLICHNQVEAQAGLRTILLEGVFGQAGAKVVIESFMTGEEASVFVLTDGRDYVVLPAAQDHKRIGEGDTGPNTGGMGAYAPAPVMTPEVLVRVQNEIIIPTLNGMVEEGSPYTGILYVGIMLTPQGPKVVEYNCRFGDPETQVVLPLIKSDVVELFMRIATGRLLGYPLGLHEGAAATVVMAAPGYPDTYTKGLEIKGLGNLADTDRAVVFHAGTSLSKEGKMLTSGGRVLAVTGIGPTLQEALDMAYQRVEILHVEGAY
ncbi:MAG TPA: phosphoribosylamine--glycine ligase, partial [Rhodothermales bacterium]|nr:phosphoribosylamine--glycine ligase [Rhodothermales bacterium]